MEVIQHHDPRQYGRVVEATAGLRRLVCAASRAEPVGSLRDTGYSLESLRDEPATISLAGPLCAMMRPVACQTELVGRDRVRKSPTEQGKSVLSIGPH
jgi:hypothetical protein